MSGDGRATGQGHPEPPVAPRQPVVRRLHGTTTIDDYAWMRTDSEQLRTYLEAERRYYETVTAHSRPLQDALYDEMSQRIAPTDASVSWRRGASVYYTRTVTGKEYRQFCRRPVTGGPDEVLLDENELSEGSAYFSLGVREVSPDGSLLAYSVDSTGDEVYELRVRDLSGGSDRPDRVERTYYGFAWSADSTAFLYTVHDAAYRPYRVYRHRLGQPETEDRLVYEEVDARFEVEVAATRSGDFAVVTSSSRDTTEIRLLPSGDLDAPPRVVEPRRPGVEYYLDHVRGPDGGDLYLITNDGAEEFRLVRAPASRPGRGHWVELLAEDPAVRLGAVDAFAGHLVLSIRTAGKPALRVIDLRSGAARNEPAPLAAGSIGLDVNEEYDTDALTVRTESLIDPPSWWSLDLRGGHRTLLKQSEPPGYEPNRYVTERITATASDGVEVPVTVACQADLRRDGTAPALLYGYGAYESCEDPTFDEGLASLLDRGVVYAVAHIRGGGECGRRWWLQGRLRQKPTTFSDYLTVADMLAADGWAAGDRIATRGLSAGGLLQGAVFSQRPERWRAVVAEVPFVDCVTTMLDPSIPLTVNEWDEWGDPRNPDDYAVMSSYAPYENIPAARRPDLLVTASLHDPRVLVHEPAKWVARLRTTGTDGGALLFRPELGSAAHTGPSGRYERLRYEAEVYAFLLQALGVVA